MSWDSVARRQAGVITRGQLIGAGVSAAAIETLCHAGRLERRSRSVFLAAAAPLTYHALLWAAVLATDAVVGFQTAAFLWGLIDRPGATIDVIGPIARRTRRHIPGVYVHRVQVLDADRTTRCELPITTRASSALDYLSRQPIDAATRFADRALQRGWITRADIETRVDGQKGRAGNGCLRAVLERTGDGAAAESERALHGLLRDGGLWGWTPNCPVWIDGELAVLDVAWAGRKVAVEIDGMAFHVDADRFQGDRTRQNRLVGAGWTILRFTWADLRDRPGYVLATIHRALLLAK